MPEPAPAPGMNATAQHVEHNHLREMLRKALVAELESAHGTGKVDWVVYRAVAALDSLLADHPVNRRGRCRSCRRTGWPGRRVCMVFRKARYWLRQPTHRVQAHLAGELDVDLRTAR